MNYYFCGAREVIFAFSDTLIALLTYLLITCINRDDSHTVLCY